MIDWNARLMASAFVTFAAVALLTGPGSAEPAPREPAQPLPAEPYERPQPVVVPSAVVVPRLTEPLQTPGKVVTPDCGGVLASNGAVPNDDFSIPTYGTGVGVPWPVTAAQGWLYSGGRGGTREGYSALKPGYGMIVSGSKTGVDVYAPVDASKVHAAGHTVTAKAQIYVFSGDVYLWFGQSPSLEVPALHAMAGGASKWQTLSLTVPANDIATLNVATASGGLFEIACAGIQ